MDLHSNSGKYRHIPYTERIPHILHRLFDKTGSLLLVMGIHRLVQIPDLVLDLVLPVLVSQELLLVQR